MATTIASQVKPVANRATAYQRYSFTVEQYHQMIEAGVLTADDRVELLEGSIVCKMPHNPPHDGTITRVQRRLARILGDDWLIRIQSAITTKDSEPEPDLVVVPGPEEVYFTRHPRPQDIALLIEVADKTLQDDRQLKGPLYARARIAVYWIVNIKDSVIEVSTDPVGGKSPRYRQSQTYGRGQAVPLILGDKELVQIPVSDLLPPVAPK